MKVWELLWILAKCDPDDEVVMSSDPEGKSYSQLGMAVSATYRQHDFEVGIKELTASLANAGWTEEEVYPNPCLALWPT